MSIKKVYFILIAVIMVMVFVQVGHADDLKGYMIPEYYSVSSHHDGEEGIEGQHGFWLRRIYLGYNTRLGDGWSARVRFEMNSAAFESDKLYAYVKNAHIKKSIGGGASILAGIMEPPSFNKIEKFWGFRYIEKTAPDFFKLASSRDFGIALDGKSKGGLVYTVMYGNYSSNKGESDKGKAVYGRLGWEKKNAYVEANGHFARSGSKDVTYLSLFGGLKGSRGRFGVGYHYKEEKSEDGDKKNNGIISAFGVAKFGKKTEAFARYDHNTDLNLKDISGYVPVPAKHFESRFVIAGLNIKLHKMVQLSPNVKYVFYGKDANGFKPDNDVYLNLTAKISFKTNFSK
ncbi:MAG: porin [bacterium]|nr:porin [bacterium]